MVDPETPTKGDDGIQRILADLSAKWDLRFPPQVLQSPAKRNKERPEVQVLLRLQWLYFNDRKTKQNATTFAIGRFEEIAYALLAGWVIKPLADKDVLPTRTHSGTARNQDFLFRRPRLSEEQASVLMQTLLRYLDEAIKGTPKGVMSTVNEEPHKDDEHPAPDQKTPKDQQTPRLRRSSRTSSSKTIKKTTTPLKNGNIKAFLSKSGNELSSKLDPHSSKHQLPSSDDYKVDDALFDDIDMQDARPDTTPLQPFSTAIESGRDAPSRVFEYSDSLEEHYHTPPDSPSKSPPRTSRSQSWSLKHSTNQEGGSSWSSDTVTPQGKRRSFIAPSKPEMPRKMSREPSRRRSTAQDTADSIHGLNYIGNPDFNRAYLEKQRPFGSLHKSYFTESFSSVTSAGAMRSFSALTTPNTSFLVETPATSFDSVTERFELDPLREKPLHDRRPWQNLRGPFNFGLGIEDVDMEDGTEATIMGPPAPLMKTGNLRIMSVKDQLAMSPPFAIAEPDQGVAIQLPSLYELCRVATHTKLPLQDLVRCIDKTSDSYETLWASMATIAQDNRAAMPEKSSLAAWKQCEQGFEGVILSGNLKLLDQPAAPIFDLTLNPLIVENSYRLARKFGQDRFFVLSIPSIDTKDLPRHLQSQPDAREAILDWLVHSKHSFLGRRWRAFFVKPEKNKKSRGGPCHRIYFFAESGRDFQPKKEVLISARRTEGKIIRSGSEQDPRLFEHKPMTRAELIEWFMPAKENRKQMALKFFTRLALAVSPTTPTVQFTPDQMVRTEDAFSDAPGIRRLDTERSHEKKTGRNPVKTQAKVMNDGCARISRRAAKAVADSLNLNHTPSIFQGRIAGAKGVWMVDTLDEVIGGPDGDFWIEITDSQLKFDANVEDEYCPDAERVRFEVSSYARPLFEAQLNFQLMPILAERGVPFRVFSKLLEDDLTAKVSDLEAAMESGIAIRKWNQEVNPVTQQRAQRGVEMHGGLPQSLPEKINWFVEHGFEPKDCCRLKDLLYKSIAAYCQRLEDRMNIGVAKSAYAYMVADPLAILEEGEVHVGFSKPIDDELMLHGIDLLVARLPAALPSDIQKVRATFKVELKSYRDVIVFPSKGSTSLASLLSGGDFDGDMAWVCWDPSIVSPFVNSAIHNDSPSLSELVLEYDTTTVSDLLNSEDGRADWGERHDSKENSYPSSLASEEYVSRFLHHAFSFGLQPDFLGICTAYFEAFTYAQNDISHPSAINLALLLGQLVDLKKSGLVFDDEIWQSFKRREGLPRKLQKPAYKDKEDGTYDRKKGHLIDRLVFETAKGVRQRALHYLSTRFKNVRTYDVDVVALYKNEATEAKTDPGIAQALKDLKKDLDSLRDTWSEQCSRARDAEADELSPVKRGKRKSSIPFLSFQAVTEQIRDRFLAIRPSETATALSPVVDRWARDAFPAAPTAATSFSSNVSSAPEFAASLSRHHHWTLLKASYAFYLSHTTNFVWYTCGIELGVLKAQAQGCKNVIDPIWECLKLDGKAVALRLGTGEGGDGLIMGDVDGGGGEVVQGEEDEYGSWGWAEGVEV